MIPCGKCLMCKIEHTSEWATRCMHELLFHKEAEFITLTYDPDRLPPGSALHHPHVVTFMKALRDKYPAKKIKALITGEYGSQHKRPHYHLIIFGWSPEDKKLVSRSKAKNRLYSSKILEKLWPHGFVTIGESVTAKTAAYVAKYTVKKVYSPQDYDFVDLETGEILRRPEYLVASNGIGRRAYEKYGDQWFAHGYCVIDGRKVKIPRYYVKLREKTHPEQVAAYKAKLLEELNKKGDNSPERQATKETVAQHNHRIRERGKFV